MPNPVSISPNRNLKGVVIFYRLKLIRPLEDGEMWDGKRVNNPFGSKWMALEVETERLRIVDMVGVTEHQLGVMKKLQSCFVYCTEGE
jgi:hypothetical protein